MHARGRKQELRERRAAKRRRQSERPGCAVFLILLLFNAGFLGIGLFILRVIALDTLEARRSRMEWHSAGGVLDTVRLRAGSGSSYSLMVGYAFGVDGRVHRGDRIAFGILNSQFHRKASKRYTRGQEVLVWYDPADPSRNVLERRMGGYPVGMTLFGVLFTTVGGLFARLTLIMTRDVVRRWRGLPPL